MSAPILTTKLYIPPPPPRPKMVSRPRLIERLNAGLGGRLTLISASAGFGKTTLMSQWVASCGRRVAWLSLDEGDNDLARFLTYVVAALRQIAPAIGEGVLRTLQASQQSTPPLETLLTILLNDIATIPENFVLVLDDYHIVDTQPIDHALTFLLDHLPPQMHLVIATREDPPLPLARLRVRGELTELRVTDLRFTYAEAAGFLNEVMGLKLSTGDIAALEARTEGWIAGLQLAALALRGLGQDQPAEAFIRSFTGSHRYILDYLAEEVLNRQPHHIQTFLLHTALLDPLCGALCDAVSGASSPTAQAILEQLERANLFIVPLDNERRWYRYHHLFADLLRHRLSQRIAAASGDTSHLLAELHTRASVWYEAEGLELEAFRHAAAAHDIDRAARLLMGKGMPLHFRGAVTPVLNWLASLPTATLDARPALSVMYASALSIAGQVNAVEPRLRAAEAALQHAEQDAEVRNLIGHIAAIRAMLAVNQHEVETIIAQSRRALEYLHPDNLPVRTATIWKLGYAYQLQGEYAAAIRAYDETLSLSQASGNVLFTIMATIGLGNVHEAEHRLTTAAEHYRHALALIGDLPLVVSCEAHLGLGRVLYAWNDLAAAEDHAQKALQMARMIENSDRFAVCEALLTRIKGAQGKLVATTQPLIEPLSQRELEILRLIAQGLSNHQISQRLFLALSTVKGHNRNIFDKLHVGRRTEAVARAHELNLL